MAWDSRSRLPVGKLLEIDETDTDPDSALKFINKWTQKSLSKLALANKVIRAAVLSGLLAQCSQTISERKHKNFCWNAKDGTVRLQLTKYAVCNGFAGGSGALVFRGAPPAARRDTASSSRTRGVRLPAARVVLDLLQQRLGRFARSSSSCRAVSQQVRPTWMLQTVPARDTKLHDGFQFNHTKEKKWRKENTFAWESVTKISWCCTASWFTNGASFWSTGRCLVQFVRLRSFIVSWIFFFHHSSEQCRFSTQSSWPSRKSPVSLNCPSSWF